MARHNRQGTGKDQLGRSYTVSYQPDWLYEVKVTRVLESGRQSTKILFRNPERPAARPGPRVRTRISSREVGLDVELILDDSSYSTRRLTVETVAQRGPDRGQTVGFSISSLKAPKHLT